MRERHVPRYTHLCTSQPRLQSSHSAVAGFLCIRLACCRVCVCCCVCVWCVSPRVCYVCGDLVLCVCVFRLPCLSLQVVMTPHQQQGEAAVVSSARVRMTCTSRTTSTTRCLASGWWALMRASSHSHHSRWATGRLHCSNTDLLQQQLASLWQLLCTIDIEGACAICDTTDKFDA